MSKFISLHNHSSIGSPLDGLNSMDDLFEGAKEAGHAGVALTDHGSMSGIYDAWKKSKETGMKLIPGCEFYFTDDYTSRKSYHLVLLAQNEEGYRNLLRLTYEANLNNIKGYKGKLIPRIGWKEIEKYNKGIFCLTACSSGIISKTLIWNQDPVTALSYVKKFKAIFKDRLFLEIQPHNLVHVDKAGKEVNQVKYNEALIKYSRELDIPYVITCDAHYRNKDMAKVHDLMIAIKDKKALDDPDRFRYGVQDMYLKPPSEINDFFGKTIADIGMANSVKILNACEVPNYLEPMGPTLPKFPVHDEPDYKEFRTWFEGTDVSVPEDRAYMRYKCLTSFKEKFSDLPKKERTERWNRVKKEISVLEMRDFSSYMLIVADYANWSKRNNIAVGPGRGSCVGSKVSYLLGITAIDPMEYGLFFERFHNKEKKSFPDIDLDFSKNDKNKVKDYLKDKYGRDKVAFISNWNTLAPKVVIKDIARSMAIGGNKSIAFNIANQITKTMSDSKTLEEITGDSPKFAEYMRKYPVLNSNALKLQGITRNWATHAAGVIMGTNSIYHDAPVRIDESGNMVIQWEKKRTENFGYIKMDILGLKTLDVITDTFDYIELLGGKKYTMDTIPLNDKDTFDMIGRGETSGVFQLESSLQPLCMKIKPTSIKGIADINALGRPSCSAEERTAFIRRKYNLEKVTYSHPSLERALKPTYGISLYEEGMMMIAADCAGWDLNQADALRKITKMKGKDEALVSRTRNSFIKDCISHSKMTNKEASTIWKKEIEPFGNYGFNLAHAVAYSYISYYTAWLRCHHPTAFMCSLLNNSEDTKALDYIYNCRELNIKITPPNISLSKGKYMPISKGVIATGLASIKNVGAKAVIQILETQPYKNAEDFFYRTTGRVVNKRVIQGLAKAGAFKSFDRTRKDMHDNYQSYRKASLKSIKKEESLENFSLPAYYEEWDRKELLLSEREAIGRTVSGSLCEVFPNFFRQGPNVMPFRRIDELNIGARIKIEGLVANKVKELTIKNGRNKGRKFAKYNIEDIDGSITELTVWQDQYADLNISMKDGIPFVAICKVDEYMDKRSLSLLSMERILGSSI